MLKMDHASANPEIPHQRLVMDLLLCGVDDSL